MMRAAFSVWAVLLFLAGKMNILEALYLVVGLAMPIDVVCVSGIVGLAVFPAASLAVLLVGVEPTWELCGKTANAFCGGSLLADVRRGGHNDVQEPTYQF